MKPILGQDVSEVQGGALVRPDHGHVPFLGKDVGIDISADWNRLIPSDKQTRRYLIALWDDPSPEIRRIQGAARRYLVIWGLVGFLVGLLASSMVVALVIQRRRRLAGYSASRARLVESHNKRLRLVVVAVGVSIAIALDSVGLATGLRHDHHVVTSNPAFHGTTLEGTEVNGLMSEVLPFLAILRPRDTFYDTVAAHLSTALSTRADLRSNGQRTVFVLAEDLEDVNGMARQVGLAADLTGADFIAFSGDLTFAGLPIESYLIDTVDYYSDNKPVYFAPGLHDTEAIVAAAAERGWHVADGETQEVSGISLLTEADPRISQVGTFGVGDELRNPDVDVNQFVQDTITESCATHPDLVLLHDHELGARIAASGCVGTAVLDGRSFSYVGPTQAGAGASAEYTSGSAGGHVTTRPDPGRIQHPATFSIITTTPSTGRTFYSLVTVRPDATVEVSPSIDLRVPYQEYLSSGRTEPAD
ncbi:MAG TPA: hypothetical protein VHW64_09020 [Nocardioides sp.]|uniref:hypothetical protein n=1 Tax=Nocardioides sp. TaxID=35761 RepID=UPI002E2F9677|nr:hypothetical protein [Nocardioides sp.]HEX3930833.1 hypothetical protein [Nocardioides sp.]